MKIKQTKQLRLDELLNHIRRNKVRIKRYVSDEYGNDVSINSDGMLKFETPHLHIADTFTVEVEEEVTEDTELRGVTTFIEKDNGIFPVYTASASIRECLDSLTDGDNEPLKIFNGITEVWSAEHGIPADGVLEVSP